MYIYIYIYIYIGQEKVKGSLMLIQSSVYMYLNPLSTDEKHFT